MAIDTQSCECDPAGSINEEYLDGKFLIDIQIFFIDGYYGNQKMLDYSHLDQIVHHLLFFQYLKVQMKYFH